MAQPALSRSTTTIYQFLKNRRYAEQAVFVSVLNALPIARFDYRPHERSPSAAEIVWTLALETKACCDLVDSGRVNWKPDPPPREADSILRAFHQHWAALDRRLDQLDSSGWDKPAQLLVNDKLIREATVVEFLWYIFFDAIHHRGQLSTYIRPMGGRVPSIYGPSGDDPGS
jgi:uncharacterized damage-inducible protein DinB